MVLKGSDLTELLDTPINQILGYNFNGNGEWTQIPIQIDEMHLQKWETIKHEPDCRKVFSKINFLLAGVRSGLCNPSYWEAGI